MTLRSVRLRSDSLCSCLAVVVARCHSHHAHTYVPRPLPGDARSVLPGLRPLGDDLPPRLRVPCSSGCGYWAAVAGFARSVLPGLRPPGDDLPPRLRVPCSSVVGTCFADRSGRQGYLARGCGFPAPQAIIVTIFAFITASVLLHIAGQHSLFTFLLQLRQRLQGYKR